MKRLLTVLLFVVLVLAAYGLQAHTAVQASGVGVTTQAVGGCSCPKTAPVCCHNCDGSFAYCARSYAFCPECPAP